MRFIVFIIAVFVVLGIAQLLLMLKLRFRRVRPGQALVVSMRGGRDRVSFTGTLVFPLVERAKLVDVTARRLDIVPREEEILTTRDNELAQYRASFYLQINRSAEDVIAVCQTHGCERVSEPGFLDGHFRARLVGALRSVAAGLTYDDLLRRQDDFQDQVIAELGPDLDGFLLGHLVIDGVEPYRCSPEQTGPFR